jgi:Protein of unknown function (DUF3592)
MAWVTEFLETKWRGPIVLLGSLVLLSYSTVDLLQAISGTKWPKAPGRILTSQIVTRRFYHPSITYVYTVGNTNYTGNAYRLGDTFYWKRQTAETAVKTYAPGSTVFVSFDPSRPERSVLEPGVTPDAVSPIEWFLPIFLFAAWMVRKDMRRVRARHLIQSKRPVKFHV